LAIAAPAPPAPSGRRGRSRWRLVVAGLVVLAALAFLLARGLDDATLYFRTTAEAVAERDALADRRFRILGRVVPGSVRSTGEDVMFLIEADDVRAQVRHRGDPPELFKEGIPVVLEGRWQSDVFASDRIMVKHSSEYTPKSDDL
jgi:cytochrome c-type biogenesis protein CcmE